MVSLMKKDDIFSTPVWQGVPAPLFSKVIGTDRKYDLSIVGAGILGLVTSLFAARSGVSVCVLDSGLVGGGASGLNGGQVIPGLKYDPEDIIKQLGAERGERLASFVGASSDRVFSLIKDEKLDVSQSRTGWIQASLTMEALETAAGRVTQWQSRGADVGLLDKVQIQALTGAQGYAGGWIDRRAGVIDPLAYVRELARIAVNSGVHIFEENKVSRIVSNGSSWELETSTAIVKAQKVLLATNAYCDELLPQLKRSLVPVHSFQIATAPLPEILGAAILPGGQAVSDSRRVLAYYRRSPDGRFVLGGRGRMSEPSSADDWNHLARTMVRLFPQLAGIKIEKRWFGRVALTPDHWPHLHQPESGLWAFVGCQGRGVALMTAMGQSLGRFFADGDQGHLPFPVTPIQPIAFHSMHKIAVAATIGIYRTLDAFNL